MNKVNLEHVINMWTSTVSWQHSIEHHAYVCISIHMLLYISYNKLLINVPLKEQYLHAESLRPEAWEKPPSTKNADSATHNCCINAVLMGPYNYGSIWDTGVGTSTPCISVLWEMLNMWLFLSQGLIHNHSLIHFLLFKGWLISLCLCQYLCMHNRGSSFPCLHLTRCRWMIC